MYPTDTFWDSMILALFALCQDEVEHVTLSEGCDVCEAPRAGSNGADVAALYRHEAEAFARARNSHNALLTALRY